MDAQDSAINESTEGQVVKDLWQGGTSSFRGNKTTGYFVRSQGDKRWGKCPSACEIWGDWCMLGTGAFKTGASWSCGWIYCHVLQFVIST